MRLLPNKLMKWTCVKKLAIACLALSPLWNPAESLARDFSLSACINKANGDLIADYQTDMNDWRSSCLNRPAGQRPRTNGITCSVPVTVVRAIQQRLEKRKVLDLTRCRVACERAPNECKK